MTAGPLPRLRRTIGRREVIGLGMSSLAVLAGSAVVSRRVATVDRELAPLRLTNDVDRLNAALNLAYLGAQYHRRAAIGDGLPPHLLTGVGEQGAAHGGRRIAFRDPELARQAREIADDKVATVVALRAALGNAAAAQPVIDLSGAPRGAFAVAGHGAGLATGFDPFADDHAFLLGAFLVGNEVAACDRTLLLGIAGTDARRVVAAVLGDAIYHGGLVRSLLAARTVDPVTARALASLCAMQALATGADGADLIDAAGHPIPFLRGSARMTAMPYPAGGFFPAGFNGLAS